MNGLYSESALDELNSQWSPGNNGNGAHSAGPEHFAQIEANAKQRTTLDDLARLADMANRVDAIVTAYEDEADRIELSYKALLSEAEASGILIAGVPEWWRLEVLAQRGLRNALVDSYRKTAFMAAQEYGIK